MKRNLKCPNCGNVMASVGKQVLRIGPINAVLSVLVYPDMGAPIAFDAYVCEGCGKFELFADRDAKDAQGGICRRRAGKVQCL